VFHSFQHSQTKVTTLMAAAGQGNISVLEQLLALGADVAIKASNGWMARSIVQTIFIQHNLFEGPMFNNLC
jgi:hypothetical protein